MPRNLLIENNINYMYHVSPLHYFVFLAREKRILSKEELYKKGFNSFHFRSTSKNADEKRGFDSVIHLTNKPVPPILLSKLIKGYPHIEICIEAEFLSEDKYYLCKYNIAKNRGLYTESEETGYCYNDFKIPIAVKSEEKSQLLEKYASNNHIEILVKDYIKIPNSVIIRVYSEEDMKLINKYITLFHLKWHTELVTHDFSYNVDSEKRNAVIEYLNMAYANVDWTGNGLEFDR